jgi:DNA-binding transcriptional LysR family regulator
LPGTHIAASLCCIDAKPGARWDDLRLLLAVARRGSFLAGGRDLGLATSTLSRRITALEAAVGTALLERRADGARLTEAGRSLAEAAHDVELALGARMRDLSGTAGDRLAGVVRVTSGDGFADVVADAVARVVARHPDVSFELQIENRPADLARREADVAIRTMHGREGSLVYRSLGGLPYGLYAAPSYAARHGLPRTLRDLPRHACLGLPADFARVAWMRWLRAHGVARFVVRSTSFAAMLAAARAGVGIAALPERLGDGLVRVLPRVKPDPLPVWIASHVDARRRPAVRVFTDVLAERFAAQRS